MDPIISKLQETTSCVGRHIILQASVVSGVPQGTVLVLLLFLAFIKDLPKCTSTDTRLFAVDSGI